VIAGSVTVANRSDGVGSANGLTAVSATIQIDALVPIAQWTTNINLATDFTEYAYSSDVVTTAGNISSGASTVYGPEGIAIASFDSVTANSKTQKTITWRRPIQVTDKVFLEIQPAGNTAWIDANACTEIYRQYNNTWIFGAEIVSSSGSTTVVAFGNGGRMASNATYAAAGATWAGINTWKWRVRKVSNGNMAETPPVVRAEYNNNAVNTTPDTQINYQTKVEDTHSAVTVGASWKFTAPISGVYLVETDLAGVTGAGAIRLFKNGSWYRVITTSSTTAFVSASATVRLVSGDYIDIRPQSNGIAAQGVGAITITRIGS
jgi:hypothetical protein